jgi:Uma2 family endonuclease
MNDTLASPSAIETLADLLHRLGDIPLERIRFHPYPGTATEQDVIEAEARTGRLCELVDGVLVAKAMGYYKSRLAVVLGFFLETYLESNDRGIVLGADGMTRMEPGLVRMPDVAFYSWAHFPNRLLPPGSFVEQAPDLAVEILSPSNTEREMDRKRAEYFAGGTRLVWQVYPLSRRVRVYTSEEAFVELMEEDVLDGGAVLPGFTLSIRRWFERAGQRSADASE